MLLLFFSILGLALGPLLDRFVRQKATIVAFLEGFVAATILGLALGHILPEAVETSGWKCLPVAFVGLIAPQLVEGWVRGSEMRIHGAVATLALAGLFVHTLFDGAALANASHTSHETASAALGIGVVLHRLPVGLTVWWLVRRSAGTLAALLFLAVICIGTFIGFTAAETTIEHLDTVSIALFQAFVASSLVHVVLHRSLTETMSSHDHPDSTHSSRFSWSGVGALVGIAVLLFVPLSGHAAEEHLGVAAIFFSYWTASAPFLLAGFFFLGLVQALLPPTIDRWTSIRFLSACLASPFTHLHPHRPQNTPPAAALILLAATPVLGLDMLLLSVPLLGLPLAFLRLVAVAITVLAVGLLFGKLTDKNMHPENTSESHLQPVSLLRTAFINGVDRIAPWLLIGFLTAALLDIFLSPVWIASLPEPALLPGLALLGALVSLPTPAALPIGLALLHKGIPPGAVLAFLLTGPMLTGPTRHAMTSAFGKSTTRLFSGIILAGALLAGLAVNNLHITTPSLLHKPTTVWHTLSAILLGLLFVLSLLRLGPGGLVDRLGHTHNHDHSH